MHIIRIYHVNLKDNILRQIVFTDRNLFLGICGLQLLLIWYIGKAAGTDLKVMLSVVFLGASLLFCSLKFDRQTLPHLLPRIVIFLFIQKKRRY